MKESRHNGDDDNKINSVGNVKPLKYNIFYIYLYINININNIYIY